jgi:hypothetical protein
VRPPQGEANVRVCDHRLRTDVRHRFGLDRHRLGAELQPGHADPSSAFLAVARDLSVVDLDPSAQLVGLPEEVLLVPLLEVIQPGRERLVVMSQSHREWHGEESLDSL